MIAGGYGGYGGYGVNIYIYMRDTHIRSILGASAALKRSITGAS
jgi:hypothetical protein